VESIRSKRPDDPMDLFDEPGKIDGSNESNGDRVPRSCPTEWTAHILGYSAHEERRLLGISIIGTLTSTSNSHHRQSLKFRPDCSYNSSNMILKNRLFSCVLSVRILQLTIR
jgi:hypothetical protein